MPIPDTEWQPGIVCENVYDAANPFDLTTFLGTADAGGTWSGTGVVGGTNTTGDFDPTGLTGNISITYTLEATSIGTIYPDDQTCERATTLDVNVVADPEVNLNDTYLGYCSDDDQLNGINTLYDLNVHIGGNTTGGVWMPADGSIPMGYGTTTQTTPSPGLVAGSSSILDMATLPQPADGGVAEYGYYYVAAPGQPCQEISLTPIIVTLVDEPDASFDPPAAICLRDYDGVDDTGVANGETPYDLNATIVNADELDGAWSSSDATIDGLINPAGLLNTAGVVPGIYSFTYTAASHTDGTTTCDDAVTIDIELLEIPNTDVVTTITYICEDDNLVNIDLNDYLTPATTAGGFWTGVDPASNGALVGGSCCILQATLLAPGVYTYEYTVDVAGSCQETSLDVVTIEIIGEPDPMWTAPADLCRLDAGTIDLSVDGNPVMDLATAAPSILSADWTSDIPGAITTAGVLDYDVVLASVAQTPTPLPATVNVTYTVTSQSSDGITTCVKDMTLPITINPVPNLEVCIPEYEHCDGNQPISFDLATSLSAGVTTTENGSFSGPGVVAGTNIVLLGTLPPGVYTYDYTAGYGDCTDVAVAAVTIEIVENPDPLWEADPNIYCSMDAPIDLTTFVLGTPGGTWTVTGSSDYVTGITCGTCITGTELSGTNNSIFDPAMATPGTTYDITYTVESNGTLYGTDPWDDASCTGAAPTNIICTQSYTSQITVLLDPEPEWDFGNQGFWCEEDGFINLYELHVDPTSPDFIGSGLTTEGGFFSGPGVTGGEIFNPVGLSGDINITYTVGTGICAESWTEVVFIAPIVNAFFLQPPNICETDELNLDDYLIPGLSTTDGQWTVNGTQIPDDLFDGDMTPVVIGINTVNYEVWTNYDDDDDPNTPPIQICSQDFTLFVVVEPLPVLVLTQVPNQPICPEALPIMLSADVTENGTTTTNPLGGVWTGMGITDNFTGVFSPILAGVGVHTVSYTYTNGLCTVTETMTIEVGDVTAPVLTCPATQPDVPIIASCSVGVDLDDVTATDECPGDIKIDYEAVNGGTVIYSGTGIGQVNASNSYPLGVTTITYVATDANGNTSMCEYSFEILDEVDPLISCPSNPPTVVNDATSCGALVSFEVPTASDNCNVYSFTYGAIHDTDGNGAAIGAILVPAGTVVTEPEGGTITGDYFPVGTSTVTFTVVDPSGNTNTCVETVVVTDNEAPVVTCPADPGTQVTSQGGTGDCMAAVTVAPLTATDNCTAYGPITITHEVFDNIGTLISSGGDDASGNYPVGTSTIEWTVVDYYDNVTTCETSVTVMDDEAPVIDCTGATIVLTPVGGFVPPIRLEELIAIITSSDNCGTVVPVDASQTNFVCADEGSNTITFTVGDAFGGGNTTSCDITVIVEACCVPDAGAVAVVDLTCPGEDISVTTNNTHQTQLDYETYIIAVDNANIVAAIQAVDGTGSATFATLGAGLPAGTYTFYSYNVQTADQPTNPPTVGQPLNISNDGCWDLAEAGSATYVPDTFVTLGGTVNDFEGDEGGVSTFYYNTHQIEIIGGEQPYVYEWDNSGYVRFTTVPNEDGTGVILQIIYSDNATWNVTITDQNSCDDTQLVFNNDPGTTDPIMDITNYDITSQSSSVPNGAIDIIVEGGDTSCGDYTYVWAGPVTWTDAAAATTANISGLPSGWYTVTVSDCGGQQTVGWYWVQPTRRGRGKLDSQSLTAYPNPFSAETTIEFSVAETMNIQVGVFGLDGREVAEIYNDTANADETYKANFNANDLPAGIYLIRLTTANGEVQHHKLILSK